MRITGLAGIWDLGFGIWDLGFGISKRIENEFSDCAGLG